MAATNRLPQVPNAQITYVGDLGSDNWLSVVDASKYTTSSSDFHENNFNPCVSGTDAAHSATTQYSGAVQAASGTKAVTIPQSTLLQDNITYAVCYASGYGNSSDTTWRDVT